MKMSVNRGILDVFSVPKFNINTLLSDKLKDLKVGCFCIYTHKIFKIV